MTSPARWGQRLGVLGSEARTSLQTCEVEQVGLKTLQTPIGIFDNQDLYNI